MKKAVIAYNSKTGTTKKYAEEIGAYLQEKELKVTILPIEEYTDACLNEADYFLIGCWTSGLMFFLQHPEKIWKEFATNVTRPIKQKTALFTTYTLITGSMFKTMRKGLGISKIYSETELKSRKGTLSEKDKARLDLFIN